MPTGLIGRKIGMTRVFTQAGVSLPVTVIHAPANCVTQVKTPDSDGYRALQVAAGGCKLSRLTKPVLGHYKKAGVEPRRSIREFRIAEEEMRSRGDLIQVDSFSVGEKVNVTGVSKGKGFAGSIKRHHFKSQDATHGNSLSHRSGGSIGQCQTPGRVFKGKKMAGHMGDARVTARNLTVVVIDRERELLLLQGAVPGSRGSEVTVHHLVPVAPSPAEEATAQEQVPEDKGDVTAQPAVEQVDAADGGENADQDSAG